MGLKFSVVPAIHPGEAEAEMNAFLRGHRVVSLKRKLVMNEGCAVWCVSAEYVESPAQAKREDDQRRNRVDWRELLPPEDFVRYNQLRDLRKKIAEAEGIPVYAIFTNEQLAGIAQKRPANLPALQELDGVGEGKAQRYGERILALVAPPAPPAAAPSTPLQPAESAAPAAPAKPTPPTKA